MIVRPAEPGDAHALVRLGRAVGSEPGGWLITTSGASIPVDFGLTAQ